MASVLKVDKLDPQSGTALEIGTSGDTVSIPSGATLDISASTLTPPATLPASSGVNLTALNATNLGSGTVPTARLGTGTASSSTVLYGDNTWAAAGGDNTPTFYAYCNDASAQFNNTTDTTVVLDAELFDSDSKFDTTTYKFTPTVAGKYFLYGQVRMNTNQAATLFGASINKNGSTIAGARFSVENQGSGVVTTIVDANTTDYFTLEAYQNTGYNHNFNASSSTTYFTGFKLIT